MSYNIKRRLFCIIALKILDEESYELHFDEFKGIINTFLSERGFQTQSENDLREIIENSNLLYLSDSSHVGFKQQAFIEYFASIEIYHHKREQYYPKLIEYFNDVSWQNTAIFYAGHSKELVNIIDDVVNDAPNNTLKDYFINTGGMGYLAQALYLTTPEEKKKLIHKSLDNMIKAFYELKELSKKKHTYYKGLSLPVIANLLCYWFLENFKSITLKSSLTHSINELKGEKEEDDYFHNSLKRLILAATMMNTYIGEEKYFEELIEEAEFMNHPILPLTADMILEIGLIDKSKVNKKLREKIKKKLKKQQKLITYLLKEPAYRFSREFKLEDGDSE